MRVEIRFGTAALSVLADTLAINRNVSSSPPVTQASVSFCRANRDEVEDSAFFIHVRFITSATLSDSCFLVLSLYHLVVLSVFQIGCQFSIMSLLSPVLRSITLKTRHRRLADTVFLCFTSLSNNYSPHKVVPAATSRQ